MSTFTLAQKKIIRKALKDLHSDHVLTSFSEVFKACIYVFKQKQFKVRPSDLLNKIISEEFHISFESKASASRRNYTKRAKPKDLVAGSQAHYTNAERNFVQTIIKTLNKYTSYDLIKGKNVSKVIAIFRELYPKIFGNEPFRTDQALKALIRKEQKRVLYGFYRYLPGTCSDDYLDMDQIRRRLRKLVVRRVKHIEDEQPFIL